MSSDETGSVHNWSDAGIAGKHPDALPLTFLVAPSTDSELNRAKLPLIPVACWRVDDIRFAFDSSFVTSDVQSELAMLVNLREAHKGSGLTYPPLSVFGHADPVGSDDYNKALSGRRARAVYALLISNQEPAKAVGIWQQLAREENWGAQQQSAMQDTTGLPSGTTPGDLLQGYFKELCPSDLKISPVDFLAQGVDAQGKGDFQGCSEFNPLLIFSQAEEDEFEQSADHSARNTANATNRRVLILLFRPGSKVVSGSWPCPRATEGIGGCQKRFWSDGENRRSIRLPDQDREFSETGDTFACRFFQRITSKSPCQSRLYFFRVRLYDPTGKYIANAPYQLTVGDQSQPTKIADENGLIEGQNVELPNTCSVEWGFPPPDEDADQPVTSFPFKLEVYLSAETADDQDRAVQMLNNIGYPDGGVFEENVSDFQCDYQEEWDLEVTGQLDAATKAALEQVHARCENDLRETSDKSSEE